MARKWSHTAEAYEAVRANIARKPREWLAECWSEIQAQPYKGDSEAWVQACDEALRRTALLPAEVMAEAIWSFAQRQRLCESEGTDAWCCPDGCHTVAFSCEDNT
jgi:hypothetical protein